MREIRYISEKYNADEKYTFDEENMTISDEIGNIIKINPTQLYELNLPLFIHLMFEDIYKAVKSFNEDVESEELNQFKCEEFK